MVGCIKKEGNKLSHIHNVTDCDNKFIIDGISRTIKEERVLELINTELGVIENGTY